jgi:hypothetical protein
MEILEHFQHLEFSREFYVAMAAIVLHVANYNITAHLEYHTRIFTKVQIFIFYQIT